MGTVSAALAAAILLWGVFIFNRLIRERNRVRSAWSDIDVQLKRRHELVPRLVEAVRQYARYEQATLKAVTELRVQSERAGDVDSKGRVEIALGDGMQRLIALGEQYPDLQASDNFLKLQQQLVEVEDFIQYARRYYNGAVRMFNTYLESFPDLLVARALGFQPAQYFALEADAERQVPELRR